MRTLCRCCGRRGHCIALRSKLFRKSHGFDPSLKFDDIELVRRPSKGKRFGLGAPASSSPIGAAGNRASFVRSFYTWSWRPPLPLASFEWTNRIAYEFGDHDH